MKKNKLYSLVALVAIVLLFTAFPCCNYDTEKDGMVVVDPNTGKKYLLIHNVGDNYFIHERTMKVTGKDTTWVFYNE